MSVTVLIIGVGMGPQHVTAEAAEALRCADYVLAADKGDDDGLLALRQQIVGAYTNSAPLIAIRDPERDRSDALTADGYLGAVTEWHTARARAFAHVLGQRRGVAAFLVWGDPSLYDSTIRIVQRVRDLGVALTLRVIPGISAPQLLAARHGIVLHEIGRPVHITTGRRLQEAVASGQDNIIAMLNPPPERLDLSGLRDWMLWWGANLGAPGEQLVHGRLGEVSSAVVRARSTVKAEAGWVMDVLLVRKT